MECDRGRGGSDAAVTVTCREEGWVSVIVRGGEGRREGKMCVGASCSERKDEVGVAIGD